VLDAIRDGVKQAVGYTDDVEFSAQDATRTELGFLLECFRVAVEAGATTINVPDTVGYAMPHEFGELVRQVRAAVPDHVVVSTHCHNDLGLAVANSLAGIVNGARQVEVAVNGIGERAGNCSLEEIAMIVRTRGRALGVGHRLNAKEIMRTSRLVSMTTGYSVQPNTACWPIGPRTRSWTPWRSAWRATGSSWASTPAGTRSPMPWRSSGSAWIPST
jgi:2-isopropylmalate synthase